MTPWRIIDAGERLRVICSFCCLFLLFALTVSSADRNDAVNTFHLLQTCKCDIIESFHQRSASLEDFFVSVRSRRRPSASRLTDLFKVNTVLFLWQPFCLEEIKGVLKWPPPHSDRHVVTGDRRRLFSNTPTVTRKCRTHLIALCHRAESSLGKKFKREKKIVT